MVWKAVVHACYLAVSDSYLGVNLKFFKCFWSSFSELHSQGTKGPVLLWE